MVQRHDATGPEDVDPFQLPGSKRTSWRDRDWVSKTDLVRYLRCPYAFSLLDSGALSFPETIDDIQARLIQEGTAFHRRVEAGAVPAEVDASELQALAGEADVELFGLATFENAGLRIYGRPDAVRTANGALLPVEVKSHKNARRTDELELAFYWMLLEPYRTRAVSPRGFLILRRGDDAEEVEVELCGQRFDEVARLIGEVRRARREAPRPRICACGVCSGVMREEVDTATRSAKDLTMIWNLGRASAQALEQLGVVDYDGLLDCRACELVAALACSGLRVSVATVEGWQRHAQAYALGRPVMWGRWPLGSSFIALDLEYENHIWLIGACVVEPGCREYVALWADTPTQERANLRALADLVDANPLVPVVTWFGLGADIPNLRRAAARLGLHGILDDLLAQHVDLGDVARRGIRLPIPSLALSDVAAYFGASRIGAIRGGFEAQWLYGRYATCPDQEEQARMKQQLVDYNRDDLDGLIAAVEAFGGATVANGLPPLGREGADLSGRPVPPGA